MPLTAIEAPKDVLTTNQWVMDVDGVRRATFVQVSGINRAVGTVPRADGGTGIVYKFSNQLIDFGTLALQRMVDPEDPTDNEIEGFIQGVIDAGTKLNGEITKFHFGVPLFKWRFTGLLFFSENNPVMIKHQTGAFLVSYQATIDFWEKVPAAA